MNIKDIINAFQNDEVECKGKQAFFFTALCDGDVKQASRATSIEDEIHMLALHMEAVRTIFVRHGKELGFNLIMIFQTQQNGWRFLPLCIYQLTKRYKKLLTAIVLRQSVLEYRG